MLKLLLTSLEKDFVTVLLQRLVKPENRYRNLLDK
jgi:hypothetical protein